MRRPGAVTVWAVVAVLAAGLTGCTGGEAPEGSPGAGSDAGSGRSATGSTGSDPDAPPPPPPLEGVCYDLDATEALSPTSGETRPVECGRRHTTLTFEVGTLDTVVEGHLLRVDADRVQADLATACRRALPRFLGGSRADLDLSMFTTVWFSPSVEQSEGGADWFRCDVAALARDGRLAPLGDAELAGALDRPRLAADFGLCATGAPSEPSTDRVICSATHSWRALDLRRLEGGETYPGVAEVRRAGDQWCNDLVGSTTDAVSYRYAWEWPTAQQWSDGQRAGYCWAPDRDAGRG